MPRINLSKDAERVLRKLPAKHARQIAERLQALADDPALPGTAELKGYAPLRRAKAGEYRIIYYLEGDVLFVPLIGKRNDDEVYRLIERMRR
jgi:mRNA interferase RelE/StbE